MIKSLFVALGVVSLVACGSSSSNGPVPAPEQACFDTADAVAKAAVRCNYGDYQSNYNAFVQAAANGNCANVTSVRDMTSLRGTCLPSLASISCADLMAANLDPSCKMQLLRTQSFTPPFHTEPERTYSTMGSAIEP